MNLLIYVPQMAVYGGMERHVTLLARRAAGAGHRVDIWTTSNSLAGEERKALRAAGVGLRELPAERGKASAMRKASWILTQVARSRLARDRWDTIYTNGQSALARWVWLACSPGTRIVHHHHTAADPTEQASWSPAFRRVLHAAPVLAGCSEFTASQLSKTLGRPDVLSMPYLTAELIQASAVVDSPLPGERPLNFGFLGRLVPTKGIDTILALSQLPNLADIHWELHGDGPAAPNAPTLSAHPRVSLHSRYANPAEQVERLSRLDAVALFTRHQEGQPLSLTEAMAAGLPWIATDRGGTRELAKSPVDCELLPVDADLQTVATGVRRLAERIRSGATSRQRQRLAYDTHFSPSSIAPRWLKLLGAS